MTLCPVLFCTVVRHYLTKCGAGDGLQIISTVNLGSLDLIYFLYARSEAAMGTCQESKTLHLIYIKQQLADAQPRDYQSQQPIIHLHQSRLRLRMIKRIQGFHACSH